MYKHRNWKLNIQLFAGGGGEDTTIEIDGKKYGAEDIKGVLAKLSTTEGSLTTLQGEFKGVQDNHKTIAQQLEELKNKGKPELDILQGKYTSLEAKLKDSEDSKNAIALERRADWVETIAAKYGLEKEFYADVNVTLEDTKETLDEKLKAKKESIDRLLGERAKKSGIILKGKKPGDGEKSYGTSLGEKEDKKTRKAKYDL